MEFYKTRAMDVRYEENPNIPLCIVNTFYYSLKYSFPIKYKLCQWITNHYSKAFDFRKTQLNHFEYIIFKDYEIDELVNICLDLLPILGKDKNNSALLLQ